MTIFLVCVIVYLLITLGVGLWDGEAYTGLLWPVLLLLWIIHLAGFRIR